MAKKIKRGAPPVVRNKVLLALLDGPATVVELGTNPAQIHAMKQARLVANARETVPKVNADGSPARGRPSQKYRLTIGGRSKARSLANVA